jgi:hypothetical protein
MRINGAETTPGAAARGHILLVGGAPAPRRGQLLRPEASLALLATVPTTALLASDLPADTVQLADPAEPQALLAYLRSAAAVTGPLLLALVGVLTADRRQRQPHLALARTRPDNARYTALPWAWLAAELRDRPAGSTTVLVDLVADKEAWGVLAETGSEPLTAGLPLWGQVSPPDTGGDTVAAPYTRALVDLLRRSTGRSTLADLHQLAVSNAGLPERALVLGSRYVPFASGGTPGGTPGGAPVAGPVDAFAKPPRPAAGIPRPAVTPARPVPALAAAAAPPPPVPVPAAALVPPGAAARAAGATLLGPPVLVLPSPSPAPSPASSPSSSPASAPSAAPGPRQSVDALLAASAEACRAGDLEAARRLARGAEEQATWAGGSGSAPAVAAREARAHLAHQSGDLTAATELWRDAAEDRLALQQPDDPQVRAAVDNAHACWARIADPTAAAELGPALVALRRRVPGPGGRALLAAERQLERLQRDR